jgi:hypothetical protein
LPLGQRPACSAGNWLNMSSGGVLGRLNIDISIRTSSRT